MPYKILVAINDVNDDLLNTIYNSLKPEEQVRIRGVKLMVMRISNEGRLVISIEANKLNVLRAALHSTLRLIKLTVDVIDSLML
ncbi:MAG: KEOPS complex subunit Pcc1 [Sulfolobales archaeon]|nr:KEOPS complex subunit Pcc1 [Sulfolobales archaeon]MCX8185843.1 KEOPS complex subunit Pcc1 [Sulfolobales archaeon]MDW7969100.1 KEOPS complex subunit Pcc1 [Sulfolobales archaeon]